MHLKKFLSLAIFLALMTFCGCSLEQTVNAEFDNSKNKETQQEVAKIFQDSGAPPKDYGAEEKLEDVSANEPVLENLTANFETSNVEEILQSLSLEEKIGQMMIFGFHGTTANEDVNSMFNQCHMGGIILFDRNMENKAQVRTLNSALQAGKKIPLFIALDEEGGQVARMTNDLIPPPSQKEIGSSGNSALAYNSANSIAQELKNIGINLNFAPVADVGTPDTRSFGNDGYFVAEFVSQAAQGYEDAGIFYCLKHFPGIGLWKVDSHEDLSTITADRYTLESVDLVPFKENISRHDNSKFMIMVSHYKYTAFDAENSATLSYTVMTELLRNELGFNGVIITDDLDMGAISKYHDESVLGVQSVKAGADIILSCHEYEKQRKIYNGILEAVRRGEISEQRIDESVRRILEMKMALLRR